MKLGKQIPFFGRDTLAAQREAPLKKHLAAFTLDPGVVLLGRETIYRDGERVGWLTTGGFGYTVDGYVRRAEGLSEAFLRTGHPSACRPGSTTGRSTTRQANGSRCEGKHHGQARGTAGAGAADRQERV